MKPNSLASEHFCHSISLPKFYNLYRYTGVEPQSLQKKYMQSNSIHNTYVIASHCHILVCLKSMPDRHYNKYSVE
jgi:hypothetical protein